MLLLIGVQQDLIHLAVDALTSPLAHKIFILWNSVFTQNNVFQTTIKKKKLLMPQRHSN